MPATIVAIADAVTASLNAGGFSLPFTAVRAYQPEFTPDDTATLRVSVVPEGLEATRQTRARFEEDHKVWVLFQHRTQMSDAELDALMALVEEVSDRLRGSPLPELGLQCVGVANVPLYAVDRLAEFREFCSLLTVTYRAWR